MAVAKLCAFEVKRFRSLVDLKLGINDALPVVICGENNIGKTNFLRALNIFFNHLFVTCSGSRASYSKILARIFMQV